MDNKELVSIMSASFAGFAREEGIRGKNAHAFVAGCLQTMLEFAYNSLDNIIVAYDAGDEEAVKAAVDRWKAEKAGILRNHLG